MRLDIYFGVYYSVCAIGFRLHPHNTIILQLISSRTAPHPVQVDSNSTSSSCCQALCYDLRLTVQVTLSLAGDAGNLLSFFRHKMVTVRGSIDGINTMDTLNTSRVLSIYASELTWMVNLYQCVIVVFIYFFIQIKKTAVCSGIK